ncbi:MAG: hypothetical protein JST86_12555 [Bacteroidetes bacterium]|nr:hypothetical protein [Bacteroidota bacterium]
MKSLRILMMAVFSILTISAIAQNQSKKEQMKMEVMKIQSSSKVFVSTGAFLKAGLLTSLSAKEQMKSNVTKTNNTVSDYYAGAVKSPLCPDCLVYSTASPKEQMKLRVMNLDKCSMSPVKGIAEAGKCSICGMGILQVKSKVRNSR